eukprot:1147355-Pelagomonas_calceolata.AAC.2
MTSQLRGHAHSVASLAADHSKEDTQTFWPCSIVVVHTVWLCPQLSDNAAESAEQKPCSRACSRTYRTSVMQQGVQ